MSVNIYWIATIYTILRKQIQSLRNWYHYSVVNNLSWISQTPAWYNLQFLPKWLDEAKYTFFGTLLISRLKVNISLSELGLLINSGTTAFFFVVSGLTDNFTRVSFVSYAPNLLNKNGRVMLFKGGRSRENLCRAVKWVSWNQVGFLSIQNGK